MAKRILLVIGTLLLAGGLGVPAYGWNSYGHMAVAYVAYQNLTPAAKARVKVLLSLNPKYSQWVGWVPTTASAADKDMMVFMLAAQWADEIKGDSTYNDDGSNGGNTPDGAPSSQNTGYTDLLRHRYFHFVDTPFTNDGSALPAIPTPNAQERIALFRGVLASTSDDKLKSYDLTWLLHLVGDVHQPLHCATRVSNADPGGDNGGNKVKLNCSGCAKELHAFWDDLLGAGASAQAVIKPVIKAAKKLPAADAVLAAKSDEKDWIAESFQVAQQTVYQPPVAAGDGPFSLTTAYQNKAKTLAKQRIALAGVRLANLINTELK
jgi:S1/P1 nuclease